MNGELAELICLATHGTAWLAGGSGQQPPALDRDNSTFTYVGSVDFRFDGSMVTRLPCGQVASWLAQLAGLGARRIWLVLPEPHLIIGSRVAADEFELAGAQATRFRLAWPGPCRLEVLFPGPPAPSGGGPAASGTRAGRDRC